MLTSAVPAGGPSRSVAQRRRMAPGDVIESTRCAWTTTSRSATSRSPWPRRHLFDLAPVHLVTTSSLEELTRLRPGSTFVPRRFRPNLMIETGQRFLENAWSARRSVSGLPRVDGDDADIACACDAPQTTCPTTGDPRSRRGAQPHRRRGRVCGLCRGVAGLRRWAASALVTRWRPLPRSQGMDRPSHPKISPRGFTPGPFRRNQS